MSYFLFLFATVAWGDPPSFQSGDIIFQTSGSKQSYAIMWATKSLYSHVGVIEVDGNDIYVIEAVAKVKRTSLKKWIARGRFGRYAVFRYPNLDINKQAEIVRHARSYLGRNYDLYFSSKNREIYCSELVNRTFADAGIRVGNFQKVRDLNVDNRAVRQLVKERWRNHPVCKHVSKRFEDCWERILEDELVTPESLAADPRVEKVWSNYL